MDHTNILTGNSNHRDVSLEDLLKKAIEEPSYRPEFYNRLLTDDLTIITINNELKSNEEEIMQDDQIKIASFPEGQIPMFTSKERIFDQGIITDEVDVLQLTGKHLFEITQGATLVLNPYSEYGKEFLPEDVEILLSRIDRSHLNN